MPPLLSFFTRTPPNRLEIGPFDWRHNLRKIVGYERPRCPRHDHSPPGSDRSQGGQAHGLSKLHDGRGGGLWIDRGEDLLLHPRVLSSYLRPNHPHNPTRQLVLAFVGTILLGGGVYRIQFQEWLARTRRLIYRLR